MGRTSKSAATKAEIAESRAAWDARLKEQNDVLSGLAQKWLILYTASDAICFLRDLEFSLSAGGAERGV
jgi:hypothetical protein